MNNVVNKLLTKSIEARDHLSAALAQSIESDDQIIMQHVRDAYVLLGGQLSWLSAQVGQVANVGNTARIRDAWMQYERDTR